MRRRSSARANAKQNNNANYERLPRWSIGDDKPVKFSHSVTDQVFNVHLVKLLWISHRFRKKNYPFHETIFFFFLIFYTWWISENASMSIFVVYFLTRRFVQQINSHYFTRPVVLAPAYQHLRSKLFSFFVINFLSFVYTFSDFVTNVFRRKSNFHSECWKVVVLTSAITKKKVLSTSKKFPYFFLHICQLFLFNKNSENLLTNWN